MKAMKNMSKEELSDAVWYNLNQSKWFEIRCNETLKGTEGSDFYKRNQNHLFKNACKYLFQLIKITFNKGITKDIKEKVTATISGIEWDNKLERIPEFDIEVTIDDKMIRIDVQQYRR